MKAIIVNRSLRYRGKFSVVLRVQKDKKRSALFGTPTLIADGAEKKQALNLGMDAAKEHRCVLIIKTETPDPRSSQIGAD